MSELQSQISTTKKSRKPRKMTKQLKLINPPLSRKQFRNLDDSFPRANSSEFLEVAHEISLGKLPVQKLKNLNLAEGFTTQVRQLQRAAPLLSERLYHPNDLYRNQPLGNTLYAEEVVNFDKIGNIILSNDQKAFEQMIYKTRGGIEEFYQPDIPEIDVKSKQQAGLIDPIDRSKKVNLPLMWVKIKYPAVEQQSSLCLKHFGTSNFKLNDDSPQTKDYSKSSSQVGDESPRVVSPRKGSLLDKTQAINSEQNLEFKISPLNLLIRDDDEINEVKQNAKISSQILKLKKSFKMRKNNTLNKYLKTFFENDFQSSQNLHQNEQRHRSSLLSEVISNYYDKKRNASIMKTNPDLLKSSEYLPSIRSTEQTSFISNSKSRNRGPFFISQTKVQSCKSGELFVVDNISNL